MVIGNWTKTLENQTLCESYAESARWVGTSCGRSRREREECTRHREQHSKGMRRLPLLTQLIVKVGFEGQDLPS